jgi:hypothetical protein
MVSPALILRCVFLIAIMQYKTLPDKLICLNLYDFTGKFSLVRGLAFKMLQLNACAIAPF